MSNKIAGILPILHTPFLDNDEIDVASLEREIDWAFELGVQGVCSAMVSEILRLTTAERIWLNQQIVQLTRGRGVVVASVGAESIKQALVFAQAAGEAGCDAIMAIPPISTSLPEKALRKYFSTLAEQIDLPLIVQDASSYVGGSMSIDFYIRLLDQFGPDKILFKPEASPIGPNLSALRDQSGGRARAFDGSGGILLIDAWRRGITGTMPGVDLLDGITALWQALNSGDETRVYQIYFPICALVALQIQGGLDGFLAIEKYILVKRGIFASQRRRAPYAWTLDEETRQEVDRLMVLLARALQTPTNLPEAPQP